MIPALGGAAQQIGTILGHGLSWSPDGKFLAISHQETLDGPRRIYLLSLDTREMRQLTAPPPQVGDSNPRFSVEGKALAFRRGGVGGGDVYLVSVEDGTERRLTFENRSMAGLDWAADGESIIFSAGRPGRVGYWSLWRVSLSGGEPEPLEVGEEGAYPSVSRENDSLAYERRDNNWNIWRVGGPSAAPETKIPERFIASTGIDYLPHYSPNGTRIAFTSNRSGFLEIWVCDSDGQNLKPLTFLENPLTLNGRWSPDGERIAFMSRKEGSWDIYIVGVTGGLLRRLTMNSSNETDPRWSRDGSSIYFASNEAGRPEIWKMPVEGGEAIQITKNRGTDAAK